MKEIGPILRKGITNLPRRAGGVVKQLRELLHILFSMMVIGCIHSRMGRPYTIGGVTYRSCADCGAYRLFDLNSWRMHGPYFYWLPVSESKALSSPGARRPGLAGYFCGQQLKQAA